MVDRNILRERHTHEPRTQGNTMGNNLKQPGCQVDLLFLLFQEGIFIIEFLCCSLVELTYQQICDEQEEACRFYIHLVLSSTTAWQLSQRMLLEAPWVVSKHHQNSSVTEAMKTLSYIRI